MNGMMITALILMITGVGYTAWRLAMLAPISTPLRWGIALVWILLFATIVVSLFFREQLPVGLTRYTYTIGTAWIFYLLYAVMLFLLLDALRLIPALRPWLAPSWTLTTIFLVIFVGIFAWGNYRYHQKVRVPLDIQVEKTLPHPLKIIGLSDLHLGYTIGRGELEQWVKMINAEQPDLILIAGDIVDGDVRPVLQEQMAEALNQLNAPIYACLGNHEYIGGEAHRRAFLSKTKIQLLQDSVALFDDAVYIIGRDDETNSDRLSLRELTKGLDRSKPTIVLDHQPHHLQQAEEQGVDFQLSGHTHRGQVFPINLIVDRMYERSHGYHRRGQTQYYISSGIGIWGGKYRIGTQSEYTVITLSGRS